MRLTIDGDEKKFRIKEISPALERATQDEMKGMYMRFLLLVMVSTGL